MKILFTFLFILAGNYAHASHNIDPSINLGCYADDGSALEMSVVNNYEINSLKVKVRRGGFRDVEKAQLAAFKWHKKDGKLVVDSLVLTKNLRIIVAVADGTYVDEIAGQYEYDCYTK